jgi:hypothetical protein
MSRLPLREVFVAISLAFAIAYAGAGASGQPIIAVFWDEDMLNPGFRICCGNTYPLLKTLYVFVLPSDAGIKGTEFYLYPPGVIYPIGPAEYCDDALLALGGLFDPDNALQLALTGCHSGGWKLIVSHPILFMYEYTDYDWIRVEAPPWATSPRVCTCEAGYPLVNALAWDAAINFSCFLGPSCPQLEITPPPPAAVAAGDSIVLEFGVSNMSGAWHSEELTVSVVQTLAWPVTYPENIGVLRCNCTKTVPVTVKVPETLPYGAANRITIRVISPECGYAIWEGTTLLQYPIATRRESWSSIKRAYR